LGLLHISNLLFQLAFSIPTTSYPASSIAVLIASSVTSSATSAVASFLSRLTSTSVAPISLSASVTWFTQCELPEFWPY